MDSHNWQDRISRLPLFDWKTVIVMFNSKDKLFPIKQCWTKITYFVRDIIDVGDTGWHSRRSTFSVSVFRSGLHFLRSVSGQEKHTLKSGNSSFKKDARCWGNSTSQAASLAGHGYVMYGSIWRPWCTYSTQYQLVTLLRRNAKGNIYIFLWGPEQQDSFQLVNYIFLLMLWCDCTAFNCNNTIALIARHFF